MNWRITYGSVCSGIKAIGNSKSIPVVRWIRRRLIAQLN